MKRWLFNLAAGVSLVMCLASAIVCVRSHYVDDSICRVAWDARMRTTSQITVTCIRSKVFLNWDSVNVPVGEVDKINPPPGWYRSHTDARRTPPTLEGSWTLWSIDMGGPTVLFNMKHIFFALWPVPIIAAVLPALWLRNCIRKKRAARVGQCPICGYDLRATPDRCPECGVVAKKTKDQTAQS